jgi:hypothetical protein
MAVARGFWASVALASTLIFSTSAALAQKAYVRDDIAGEAARLEERLKRDVGQPAARPVAQILREAETLLLRGDARRALALSNAAAVLEARNPQAWLVMARSAIAIDPRDWRERYELQERAQAAAYTAYTRATTRPAEAAALAALGDIFAKRELWRPALTVYRLSLDAQDNPTLRTTYENLRNERGFRLTGNQVDANSATPRACFEFSEPLARGRVDFQPFVAISGGRGDFAVRAEDRQLCVEGLRHGERYAFVLRQGIPSSIPGEVLQKTGEYDVYVRDREPTVRFTGRNYVLPTKGQEGIPVVSVNTSKVSVEIARIGDRNLINTVHSGDFLTQLDEYQARQILSEKSEKIWSGSLEVKSELNKDVTTAFPVLEAVGTLKPGVYMMMAGASARPASATDVDDPDYGRSRATQWFVVSDLGLTAFQGPDGVHVLARSLASADPVRNVEVRLLARNNEILATATTDARGYVRFDPGLAKGTGGMAPGLLVAQSGPDYGFLDLKQSSFDFTDRGVKGRVAPKALDAFVATERGVYRSGESVFVTTLLRDAKGAGIAGLPLTLVARRPDGVEYRRQMVDDQGLGGRAWTLALLGGVQPGTWSIRAYSDPKGDAIGETTFLVEDYVPERLDVEVKAKRAALKSGEPAEIDVSARYLYGAVGSDLEVSGEVKIRVAEQTAIPGLEGYIVGLTDEAVEPVQSELEERPRTDAQGRVTVLVPLQEPATNRPLEAEIALRVGEPGGRAVTRTVTLPILPKTTVVGVKKLFKDGDLSEGATAGFDVVLVTGDGQRIARDKVKWTLSRVIRNFQWFYQDGRWQYEAAKTTRRVADGEISIGAAEAARISSPVEWGSYRLDVVADGIEGAETSVNFTVGYESERTADTPDVLDLVLDKAAYAAGDSIQVRLNSRFAGKATIAVMGDGVKALQEVDVQQGATTVRVPVGTDWGASAYLVAFAHRPLDAQAKRMPGRAIGLSWFTVDKASKTLGVDLGAPALVRPRTTLDLPIKLTGVTAGEEAFITVAAVDVGILNLTRYQAPNPTDYFFGQRQLAYEVRDLYGQLIDGMQGTRGAIRSGGDAPALAADADKPTQEPLARYSGVVKVGPDGTARVAFDLPAFNGTARVMAMAWTKSKTGQASADVVIRDPVVVQATLPRFLAIGDQSRFHVEINNVEGQTGDYTLDLDVRGPVSVAADAARRTVRLTQGAKTQVTIPVTAAGIGTAIFDLKLSGPGLEAPQRLALRVQPSVSSVARRDVRPIEPNGGQLTVTSDLLADMVPNSGAVSVSVSPLAALDVPALLKALDRYPYGCTEQTISRALPLLYVNRLASMEQLAIDGTADERVAAAVEKVLSRQGANGSFGLWGVGGEDLWLDAYVADFLTRAREANVAVPAIAFNQVLDRLRNQVANTTEVRAEEAAGLAYALYVLARNGRPVIGDLRYLADTKLASFATPLARAQIAAALASLGDRGRSTTAFASAVASLAQYADDGFSRPDYGTRLRDSAATLALLAEGNGEAAALQRVSTLLESARGARQFTSTQEQMWMVLAAQALAKDAQGMRLTVNGESRQGVYFRTIRAEALDAAPLVIVNPGAAPARAVVTVSGIPVQPEPALDQGFAVERTIHTFKGERVDPLSLRQNDRYVVVVKVTQRVAGYARLLLVDPLPAGLEIENPKLTEGATTEGLAFVKEEVAPSHIEARDDRYVAAFDLARDKPLSFMVAYVVRAVSPGRYVHPAVFAEDMYRPDRYGRGGFGAVEIQAAR